MLPGLILGACGNVGLVVVPVVVVGTRFTMTYTTAGLALTPTWLSMTLKLKANGVLSEGVLGAIKYGVAVLPPMSVTGIPPLVGN